MTPVSTRPLNRFLVGLLLLCGSFVLLQSWPACSDTGKTADDAPKVPAKPIYRIGLIPEQNIFKQKEEYSFLLEDLGKKLDVQFDSRILPSYGSIIKEFAENRIDGAFVGSYLTVMIMQIFPVQLVACPMGLDGGTTYSGLIIAKKGSGVTSQISTWKGRSIALVHPNTTAGYLYPLFILRKAGYSDEKAFFGKITMLGSHDAVYNAVKNGSSEIGALKNSIFKRLSAASGSASDDLVVLRESKDFPSNSLIMRQDLDEAFLQKLRDALLHLHESPEGSQVLRKLGYQRFIPVALDDYANVSELIEAIQ